MPQQRILTPQQKVAMALPGTIREISERTGYPPAEVFRQISNLRREGKRVKAQPGAAIQSDLGITYEHTIFVLVSESGRE